MDWNWGTLLATSVIFFFWAVTFWMFIAVFADIFRRDMSGWAKAGWVLLIVVLPFLGILAYLIARPKDSKAWGTPDQSAAHRMSAAEEISKANDLYTQGKITSAEYQRLKQRALV